MFNFRARPKFVFGLMLFFGLLPAVVSNAQTPAEPPFFQSQSFDNGSDSPRLTRNLSSDIAAASEKPGGHQTNALAADGDIDTTFNAGVSEGFGFVEETLVQPDGKIIIGGGFNRVNGAPRNFLARLNADGSLDTTFNPGGSGPSGAVVALARQPDGKILIGGSGILYNGQLRGLVTRLNADGTPDASFREGFNANSTIEAIAVQPDGRILIGGFFSTYNGTPRSRIARLFPDGSLDTTFNVGSGFDNPIFSIVPQPDGKVLVGGAFRRYNGAAASGITRLNPDGTLDTTFNPGGAGANSTVDTVILQADGKILAGGFFSTYNGTQTPIGVVRLNPNGTVETAFSIGNGARGSVTALAVLPNGAILAGGAFFSGIGFSRGIAVLNAPLGTSFAASQANGDILSISVLPDGKILASGSFTQYNGEERRRLVRLNPDGTPDNSFTARVNTQGFVHRVLPQADGKILVAGDFELVNNVPRSRIARLNADGSLDTTFNTGSGANAAIFALARQADGKILIGGIFDTFNAAPRRQIARLNVDGSLDSSFNPSSILPAPIYDIVVQPNGKILVGGSMTVQFFDGSGRSSSNIVRLNTDGSLDSAFDSGGISGTVRTIGLQADGKIFIGGILFTQQLPSQFDVKLIVKLNQNGSPDTSFNYSAIGGAVEVISVLPDGKILIGGTLIDQNNQFRGLQRLQPSGAVDTGFDAGAAIIGTVRALVVQADGKILVGGFFSNRIARVNANGSRDPSFNAAADNYVDDIAIQRDGKIILGGAFTILNGAPRQGIARIQGSVPPAAPRRTLFDSDGDGKADLSVFRPSNGTWYFVGSSTGFTLTQFGVATDIPVSADYDGDGKADIAVFRPSNGTWYLLSSLRNDYTVISFGENGDVPAPADYDGDGKTDIAVFRPSNNNWYLLTSAGFSIVNFGAAGDIPVAADYNGDGKSDIAVFRPSDGKWYLLTSAGYSVTSFGASGDIPVAGDYDGDGKSDLAVFRPSNSTWYLLTSAGYSVIGFGASGDIPVAGDYDGDGKTDIAVFRPSNGNWYLLTSAGYTVINFGISGDVPIASRR